MKRYSVFAIAREALRYHTGWEKAWRSPEPKAQYDAIVVGAGGHGLATAYYLGKNHGITNVAIIEKGWLGGGNTGRNTTIIRSNYLQDSSAAIYEKARSLYETMSQDLNYNVMFSPRGVMMLAQTHHEVRGYLRTAHANALQGIATEFITPQRVKELVPILNIDGPRYPVLGALWQPRGGTGRHDAVAWGYARAASALGVDIIQQSEVQSFVIEGGRCRGVVTSRGTIRADRVGMAVAGHSSQMAEKAGFRLPVTSYALQACVSEPVKPVLDTVVLSPGAGTYASQSDKGEMVVGGGLDRIPSYGQRGNLPVLETVLSGLVEMFPAFRQLKLMRQWAGIVDIVPDSSPIIGESPLPGLFLNCGWGTGGFKSIPAGGCCWRIFWPPASTTLASPDISAW